MRTDDLCVQYETLPSATANPKVTTSTDVLYQTLTD